ncbi:hypothetical protein [Actinoplanes sp. G11-F43]|uniref:hypothetical protein n=1 Tax=Actinoplanes sp. G11-F43 TaxID=3424130 RepID=UPI003D34D317
MPLPRSGDLLRLTRAASVQFANPMLFRVIRVHDWPTYVGWVWLDGYEINSVGEAVERRSVFVQIDGLRPARRPGPDPRSRNQPSVPPRRSAARCRQP